MGGDDFQAHTRSPAELKAELAATKGGEPFLMYRDASGNAVLHVLDGNGNLVLGRGEDADVIIDWDDEISRVHALVERVGGDWTIVDDGLSRNGTFVNSERLNGRRRLREGDRIRLGSNVGIVYRDPADADAPQTVQAAAGGPARISDAQRRVLVALCRPYAGGATFAAPATNQQIAEELVLSGDAVKTHMRALYDRFGIGEMAQQQKRARLVELAFRSGEITPRDLDG